MSRADVLVSADWAEENLNTPGVVFVEVDEDTSAYDGGHIAGAVKLDWKTDLQDQVRRDFVSKEQFEKLLSRRASATTTPSCSTAATTTGSPPTRTGTSSSTATRTSSCSTAAARSGSSTAASCPRTPSTRDADDLHRGQGPGHLDPRVPRRGRRRDRQARTSSTSARPTSSPASCSRPAHLPQEQSQRGGHIPTALNVPWSKAANEDGTFKSDDELRKLYGDEGLDDGKRHHRLLPHRRAVQPHLVRAARAARPRERQELRRLVDRVRLARRRPDREGRLTCAEHQPRPRPAGRRRPREGDRDLRRRPQGRRTRSRAPTCGCSTARGEFTAEVVTSATGDFRFFAAPGALDAVGAAQGRQRAQADQRRRPGPGRSASQC